MADSPINWSPQVSVVSVSTRATLYDTIRRMREEGSLLRRSRLETQFWTCYTNLSSFSSFLCHSPVLLRRYFLLFVSLCMFLLFRVNYQKVLLSSSFSLFLLGVSTIGIVNDFDGSLFATFSVHELRGLYTTAFPRFDQSIAEYLRERSPNALIPATILPTTTFSEALYRLLEKKLHRFFIVSSKRQPIGKQTKSNCRS